MCALPDLFNVYSEMIMRELDNVSGCVTGDHNINNLRYADDAVLISNSEENLQKLLDTVVEASSRQGLTLNCKKTECMVVSKQTGVNCHLEIGNEKIKQVKSFKYLGSIITEDGKCEKEIKSRIAMAKEAFQRLKPILVSGSLSLDTKKRILQCYVYSILLYGSECWTISTQIENRLKAAEMWFYRRMLKISWTSHQSNEEVLRRMATDRALIATIQQRRMSFFCHLIRKNEVERLSITGKINGKRARGRQRQTFLKEMSQWTRITPCELIHAATDRERWRVVRLNVRQDTRP